MIESYAHSATLTFPPLTISLPASPAGAPHAPHPEGR